MVDKYISGQIKKSGIPFFTPLRRIHFAVFLVLALSCRSATPSEHHEIPLLKRHAEESRIDGDRCPFYPTCSYYGRTVLRRTPVFGLLALIDRMFYRELGGVVESYYFPVSQDRSRRLRFYDPPDDLRAGAHPSLYREDFLVDRPEKTGK